MSDSIKLIIEIPKDYYEIIKHDVEHHLTDYRPFIIIGNGIPLPKGHGRLIDEKDLSLMTVHLIDGVLVCDAPTIIEADNESED